MHHDVIPLACVDWCILAASSVLAGGGGVGIGAWGGEGVNFPQIETSKCEWSPVWGQFRAQANSLHTCSTVLLLMSRLPTVGQFWCFKRFHKQGIDVMVLLAVVWRRLKGGERPCSDYSCLLHLPSEFCYISRPREECGDGRSYCEWKSKCFTDSHRDVLRRTQQGAPSSCQQAKLVLVL